MRHDVRCMAYKPPTYGFLFITSTKKNPAFAGLGTTGTSLALAVHTAQARLPRLSRRSLGFHSWFSPVQEPGFRPDSLGYLVLIIATPIRGSPCFRRMKSKALSLVVVWNSYHCEPYLYLTTKVLRLISFIVFSRGSGWEPGRFPGRGLCCYLTGLLSQSCSACRRLLGPCRDGRRIC